MRTKNRYLDIIAKDRNKNQTESQPKKYLAPVKKVW